MQNFWLKKIKKPLVYFYFFKTQGIMLSAHSNFNDMQLAMVVFELSCSLGFVFVTIHSCLGSCFLFCI